MADFKNRFLLILCALFFCHVAKAESYELNIKPLLPEGGIHTAVCKSDYPTCYLTLTFPPKEKVKNGENTYINVLADFEGRLLGLDFMLNNELLSTSPRGIGYFQKQIKDLQEKKQVIKLYALNPAAKKDSYIPELLVIRPPNIFLGAVEVSLKAE